MIFTRSSVVVPVHVLSALVALALVTVVGLGFLVGVAAILTAQGVRGVCPSEDSPSCVWITPVQGNHGGRPVIVVNGPERP